jgi:hypothetical protein
MPLSTKQLLAIRLAYDAALLAIGDGYDARRRVVARSSFTTAKYIAQLASEGTFRSNLAARLAAAPATEQSGAKKPPASRARRRSGVRVPARFFCEFP